MIIRLLTAKELEWMINTWDEPCVWLEDRNNLDGHYVTPVEIDQNGCVLFYRFADDHGDSRWIAHYGTDWRCWNFLPADHQRMFTPWDDEKFAREVEGMYD